MESAMNINLSIGAYGSKQLNLAITNRDAGSCAPLDDVKGARQEGVKIRKRFLWCFCDDLLLEHQCRFLLWFLPQLRVWPRREDFEIGRSLLQSEAPGSHWRASHSCHSVCGSLLVCRCVVKHLENEMLLSCQKMNLTVVYTLNILRD